MIKLIALILTMMPFWVSAENDSFTAFVVGSYRLIGQGIDTDATYSGHVSIYSEGDLLSVKRVINGRVTIGQASFQPTLNGDSKVLRIQFSENGVTFEETCLWGSDLDNYARVTCYLYTPGAAITKPGIEALFIDHTSN